MSFIARRRTATALLATLLALLLVAGCSPQQAPTPAPTPAAPAPSAPAPAPKPAAPAAPPRGGEVVHGMNTEPVMLDLHVGSSRYDNQVAAQIYDSLLFNDNGTLRPWLATAWEVSNGGKTFTLKLRQGVKFHDGTPFNAAAVKANWDRIVDPATKSAAAIAAFENWDKFEVVDEYTVRAHFKKPAPDFLTNLASIRLGIQSPAAMQKHGQDYGRNPVGTGPFIFKEWVAKQHITLVKNPDYAWPPEGVTQNKGPAYLTKLTYRMIPEDGARVAALENGELTVAMAIPPQNVAPLQSNPNLQVVSAVLPGTGVVLTVNASKPPTNDPAVRQALLYLTNPEEISRIGYFGQAKPHKGSIFSEPNWSFKDLSGMYPFNVDKANQILDQAGWVRGADGIRVKSGVRAHLKYIGFPSAVTQRVMEYMGATFKRAGISLEIVQLEGTAIQKARQAGEHNLAHLTWIHVVPGFATTLWHSKNIGGGWNFTHWRDKTLDDLLEAGEAEMDANKRKQIYEQIQTYMLQNGVVIPTVYQHQIMAHSKKLKGARLYPVTGEEMWYYEAYVE